MKNKIRKYGVQVVKYFVLICMVLITLVPIIR